MSTAGRRVALVTGAGGAIGGAVARRLDADGYAVAVVDIDLERAQATAGALVAAVAYGCDVRHEAQVLAVRDAVRAELGAPWLLVNVAGLFFEHRITDLTVEDWDAIIDVNLKGPFLTCKALLPAMIAARSGCIVNVASAAGVRGGHSRAAYNAAKGGEVLLTRSLALDHGPDGVRVNCVCPGLIDTPMADWIRLDPPALAEFEDSLPAGRMGTPDEIAGVVSFLASPDASYLHGSVVLADGGVTA